IITEQRERASPRAQQERHGRPRGSAPEGGQAGRQGRPRERKGRPGPASGDRVDRWPRGRSPSGPLERERAPSAERERRREPTRMGRGGEPPFLAAAEAPGGPPRGEREKRGRGLLRTHRPQVGQEDPLNLSISLSGGKETNQDSPSSGERSGKSPAPNPRAPSGPAGTVA
ncbi:basic salivary proline-rich protein 3-like, partial [Acanthaster planci]|uniref:Basic salivary proline-rich protein 3-like n=1 Tax=Acanthaster planci TaxID=133434 RepID=A0A8B8A083_ACAPL